MVIILIFRRYKEKESKEIKNLLFKEGIINLNLNNLIYIILEDNIIKGVCKIDIVDGYGLLKYIVVEQDYRGENLGEGLLRSTLNKLDNDGIKMVYYDEMDSYLIKKGFVKNKNNKLELNISSFFSTGCKCSGESNAV